MQAGLDKKLSGYKDLKDFVASLEKPRCAMQKLPAPVIWSASASHKPASNCRVGPLASRGMRLRRRVIILVKAGAPVDSTIDGLVQFMEAGDIIIDGGNEWCAPALPALNHVPCALLLPRPQ